MYRILVVDDEPQIVELLQIYLAMQGYKVLMMVHKHLNFGNRINLIWF